MVFALVALAAGHVRAATPLVVARVQQDRIGDLNIDFAVAGWEFTRDGKHVYVAGGNVTNSAGLIAHLAPDPTSGTLTFIDAARDPFGPPVVFGGLGGTMQLGPHESELYYASIGYLAVFHRDPIAGGLTLLQTRLLSDFNGDAVAVAPDGRHVLIAASGAIAVYPRAADGTLGDPMLVPAADRDAGDLYGYPEIAALEISADGRFVYALQHEAGEGTRDALLILRRDVETGALVRIQRVGDGFDDYVSLGSLAGFAKSPDGRDLLVGSDAYGRGKVVSLRLDAGGDRVVRARVVGTAHPGNDVIAVSPEGELVFSGNGSTLKVWHRDPRTGGLELVQILRDGEGGVDALDGIDSIASSPDGRFVYVLAVTLDHAVTVFRRRCGDGTIDPDEACDDSNFVSGDGCDAACRVESCFLCDGIPSTCAPVPGYCDDGDPCTVNDACVSGRCAGVSAVEGTACDDGNPCTTSETCQAGDCVPTGRVACGACGVCDREMVACVGTLGRGCERPPQESTGGRDPHVIRPPVGRFAPRHGARALSVRWTTTDPKAADGVGDPTATTGYDVCLLDLSGFDDDFPYERQRRRIVAQARVPSAAECTAASCWRRTDTGALVYHSRRGKPDGVRRLRINASPDEGLAISVTAGGRAFRLRRNDPVVAPLTVQILADGGACWQGDLKPRVAGRR